ncbi:MAG: biotin/lipoyl-containing protein [Myxococcota bacterium]
MTGPWVLESRVDEGSGTLLFAPSVGIFVPEVTVGQLVGGGQKIGSIEVLGIRRPLCVPRAVVGRVTSVAGDAHARVPVQYRDPLVVIAPTTGADVSVPDTETAAVDSNLLAYVSPMSGRFYSRSSPTEPRFVEPGDTVRHGQTVGLLEVMKTFNRLVYQGDGLPESAVVAAVLPQDGDDVVRGDALLSLEPVDGG